jgi:hypothetical protein
MRLPLPAEQSAGEPVRIFIQQLESATALGSHSIQLAHPRDQNSGREAQTKRTWKLDITNM